MRKLFAIILSLGLIVAPMPVVSNAHASGGAGYAKIVLGMANGIIGTTILLKCSLGTSQPSLLLYLTGSLTYMAAEILSGNTKKNDANKNAQILDSVRSNMKEGGDYQKAAIEAQIQNEKDNLKHIKNKKVWMMATKVAYGVAAGIASVEFIMSLSPPVGILKPDIGACKPGIEHEPISEAIVAAYAALSAYSSMGVMGGVAVGAAYALKMKALLSIGTKIVNLGVTALNSSIGRALAFSAAAALVMAIDGELTKEKDRSEKIIADLEKVKAQFDGADNSLAEGQSTSGQASGAGSIKDPSNKQYALRALPKGVELAKHCLSQSGGSMNYSEAGCKNPIKFTRPTFDARFEVPVLKAGANAALDMGQAIADGDLDRAQVSAANLASMAGRIDAVNKDLLKKVNDRLKSEGKKPIDINDELNRQIASFNKGLNEQQPGSGNITLADVTGGDAGVSENSESKDSNKMTTTGEEIDLSKIGEGIAEEGLVDPNVGGNVASLDDSLKNYESNESDISKDPEISIFKQVSNRYFLNYTKIFQRKEINPPLADPAPNP